MKKFLLTATMLVCFTAVSKAQQGRVGINTTTPATTLDVAADATNTSKPDALLVPRMTRAQLTAKDGAYVAAQNGALAFVTTIDGTASAKTTNVTSVGFYYYDSPSSTWKTLGGGAAPNPALNVTNQTGTYNAVATDDIILFTTTGPTQLNLPTTGVTIGKRIYVSVLGTTDVTINPAPRETANQTLIVGQGNILLFTGDATKPWSIISGY